MRESDVPPEAVPMLCFVISCDMITMASVACSVCSRHEAQPPIRIPYKRAVQGQLHLVMTTTTMNHNLSAGCTGDAMPTRSFLKPHLRCLEGPFKLSTHGPGASPFLAISTQKYLGPCSQGAQELLS